MVEEFSSFVKEALEFLSLLRASEKERFEAEKKFMAETSKLLKELAESIQKNNATIKTSLDDLKKSVDNEIKRIEEKIGLDKLTQAIKALDTSVDLLQRGSTIMDYKHTVQKTRDLLDDLKKSGGSTKTSSPSSSASYTPSTTKKPAPAPKPALTPQPSATVIKSSAPSGSSKVKTHSAPKASLKKEEQSPGTPGYQSSVAQMMGTRNRPPRRAVKLKKAPRRKVVQNGSGEPIEIETGSDDD